MVIAHYADIIDIDNIRMREFGCRLGFPMEFLNEFRIPLKLFMELRLVIRHRFQGTTKYEACYADNNHCHQICTVCGKVTEVKSPEIAEAIEAMKLKRFRKDGFSLYIYGICSTCQAAITRQKNNQKTK